MNVLIACEESQAVCTEFRKLGHNAFSCDIQESSGGHPEWHIRGDALSVLEPADACGISIVTEDGLSHNIPEWDIIIAHPPCTYLTVTGNRWFDEAKYGDRAKERKKERKKAVSFFMAFVNCSCERVAIENPIGFMSTEYMPPSQIIQPYWFGDPERKATCLWLRGLQPLTPTNIVKPKVIVYKNGKGTDSPWHLSTMSLPKEARQRARSKTFPGIAKAMALQWGTCDDRQLSIFDVYGKE